MHIHQGQTAHPPRPNLPTGRGKHSSLSQRHVSTTHLGATDKRHCLTPLCDPMSPPHAHTARGKDGVWERGEKAEATLFVETSLDCTSLKRKEASKITHRPLATKEFELEFPPLHSTAIACTDLSSPQPLPYSDKLSAEGCGFSWFKSHLFVPVSELSS